MPVLVLTPKGSAMAVRHIWVASLSAVCGLAMGLSAARGLAQPANGKALPGLAILPETLSQPPPAPGAVPDSVRLASDATTRMTVPVTVNGLGPYAFIIDTAAERTVIAKEVSTALNLPSGPRILVRGAAGDDEVSTAQIDALGVGDRSIHTLNAPLLSEANLGAQGMLGLDALADQRIVLDFEHHRLSSVRSRRDLVDDTAIVVRGKYQFGQLILVDAHIRNIVVYVILDTGAQTSIGNDVLRRLLTTGDPSVDKFLSTKIISVTGQTVPADFENVAAFQMGALTVHNLPMAFAPLNTFAFFGLEHKPALLLGMDILSKCKRVTIDFKRREVGFSL